MGSGPSNARRAHAAGRRKTAIELRLEGRSWQEIADELGYSHKGAAHTDVKRALEQAVTELAIPRETLRELEVQRLDAELVRLTELYEDVADLLQDPDKRLAATDRLIKIEDARRKNGERRSQLLGLDAPKRIDMSMEAIDAALAEATAELDTARSEAGEAAQTQSGEG